MRHDDIRKQYTRHGGAWNDENPLFAVGEQMQYEWQKDLSAMKWALSRMKEFIEANEDKHLPNFDLLKIGYKELLNRVSEFSCPSNLKEQYKTKEKCPLKSECRCVLT